MSRSDDLYQAGRWLDTAEGDLQAACTLMDAGHHAHACFALQQCGEKAVKAIWYALGEDPWGHSIQKLVMQCPAKERMEDWDRWLGTTAALDRFYITTRYPNGLPDLIPEKTYFQQDAEQALEKGSWLLERCRSLIDTIGQEYEREKLALNEPGEKSEEEGDVSGG
jgi:HEPN domain-containing protein